MTLPLMIAIYALNLYDFAITTHFVYLYGLEIEANPFGRWMYESGMVYPYKILFIFLMLFIFYKASSYFKSQNNLSEKQARVDVTLTIVSYVMLAVYTVLALFQTYLFVTERCIMWF